MTTREDVRRIALSLPDIGERFTHGSQGWQVHNEAFVRERPLRRTELRAVGDTAPTDRMLGSRVKHLQAKEALIADAPDIYFTKLHFDGCAAVRVQLGRIPID
ncbi:MAG: MmcQ/YjbR family DNA-binding protein [Solirubrobacterales bacterium]|nr:MmcQ/YjbR family DNA-binding protein [Solirubrobacterales bacterium]MBV9338667.1 MmcQ/YjbR family DNA-binding protein [Solirubrobacterales bacterium]MBV9917147.1 MmcQ/YjbR family DNA-binding protein [Solirubrobacterales bacterium]